MPTTRRTYLAAAVLAVFTICAHGSLLAQGTLDKAFDAFTGIMVNSGLRVELTQGSAHTLRATGDQEALDALDIKLKGETLGVAFDEEAGRRLTNAQRKSVAITIQLAELHKVLGNGGAAVTSAAKWTSESLSLVVNGGAGVELEFAVGKANFVGNGGAEIACRGTASTLQMSLNGGAHVAATGLVAADVTVSANGGAVADVHAEESLTVSANGGAVVNYTGDVERVSQSVNGGASSRRM